MPPPKPKMTLKEYEAKSKDWGRKLWNVIYAGKEENYREVHDVLMKEFLKLREEAQGLNTKVTMLDHAAPILNHIASQGYTADTHYQPLRVAVTNFCAGKPVDNWIGPPDRPSRSPSPTLPPSPQPNANKSGPSRKKRKAAISEEVVRSGDDESEKETSKGGTLPSTDEMDLCPTKCVLCNTRKHGCHVNPKSGNKPGAACFECNHWRVKCSLASNRANATKKGEDEASNRANASKKGEDEASNRANATKKGEDEEEVVAKEPPKRRRKPVQVPAGQPGQLTGELLAPEVLKRLENYESKGSLLCEKMEELTEAFARLAAENRTSREWFANRIKVLYEIIGDRDEAAVGYLKSILEQAEEMTRLAHVRELGEKLEALMRKIHESSSPPMLINASTSTIPSPPKSTAPTFVPLPQFPDVVESSSKRPPSEDGSESRKRRKVGAE